MRDLDVYGFGYKIDDSGVVYWKNGSPLKQRLDSRGKYVQVVLSNNGTAKTFSVHRLVAQAFIPNPENKSTVNHKDGVKTNNCVSNLEWATQSENLKHSYHVLGNTKGTVPMLGKFGKEHNRSKKIKAICKDGIERIFGSVSEMAREQGTSVSLGANIIKEKRKLPYKVTKGAGYGVIVTEYPVVEEV